MNWNTNWSASRKPSKQRNYVRNSPLHLRNTLLGSHLSKELRQKLKCRSLRVRKGDKVKILRGQYKGKNGTVDRVDTKRKKVYITGIEITKRDGSKTLSPVHPSNILIQDLEGSDKRRTGEQK